MSRQIARRAVPRAPEVDPDSGQGRAIGMSDRMLGTPSPIPGGQNHIINAPVVRQSAPVSTSDPEIKDVNAHGVPPELHTAHERADTERGPVQARNANKANSHRAHYADIEPRPVPVPVYLVPSGAGSRPLATMSGRKFTVPAAGGASIPIAMRDPDRTHVLLLVETAAGAAGAAPTGIRIDHEISNTDVGEGALLRAGAATYLKLECADDLFAISNDGSAVTLSVIYLYGTPGAGPV